MKYEIKHIKVLLENHVALSDNEDKILLDYITNLQEENERLNKQYDLMEQSLDDKQKVIDKAIEYIEEFYDRNEEVIEAFNFEYSYKHIISLLQGKSDE